MTSHVAGALKLVALVMVVALLIGASFLRSRDRKDPVVEVIELSGPVPSTTTAEEPDIVPGPIEVAPPSVHVDAPPLVESDDERAIDVVPPRPDDRVEDEDDDDEGGDDSDDD